jgi:nitrite reductase (NADH) large subunit
MFKRAPVTPAVLAAVLQSMDIVIVGAGIAGLTAAEQARAVNPKARLVLINDEWSLPYYRINLTRLLAGEVSVESLAIHPASWFEAQNIDLVYGKVAELDRVQGRIRLHDGRTLRYDRLILCTGAEAARLPIPGAELAGVSMLRQLDDAKFLLDACQHARHAVVIGGGLLGLEAAGALRRQGLQVCVVEAAPQLMPRQLTPRGAALLQREIESLGIEVICGSGIRKLHGFDSVSQVELANDRKLEAELVLMAAGIRPRLGLAQAAGLATGRGLLVDERMCSSDEKIFAAGDGVEFQNTIYGIWPASFAQALVAGRNAAGGDERFTGLAPSTRLKVLGREIFSAGVPNPSDGQGELIEYESERSYFSLLLRDGRIVGATAVGDASLSAVMQECVESASTLDACPELAERFR